MPQGSGVFPTVGQIDCLEELGSGRLCAATYECADASGVLWDDMGNHDGRRAVRVDSPVARERDCRIVVNGKAAARWFSGFSPDGRDGDLVGVTARHDAAPPVVRRTVTSTDSNGLLLDWLIAEHGFDIERWRERSCSHYVDGPHRERCDSGLKLRYLTVMAATPYTKCFVEAWLRYAEEEEDEEKGTFTDVEFVADQLRSRAWWRWADDANPLRCSISDGNVAAGDGDGNSWLYRVLGSTGARERAQECCELYADQLRSYGMLADDYDGQLP